jgi:aspartate/methionine/tyrosine aminotransferase
MPGIIFGKSGDGYMRFSGFCSYEDTEEAMKESNLITKKYQ